MNDILDTQLCLLSELKEGERAEIRQLDPGALLAERFGDIGLHTGVVLWCVRKSFLGDPVAYGIEGSDTVVAIRRQDADGIFVSVFRDVRGDALWD